jgi:signal transduction histidine kinase
MRVDRRPLELNTFVGEIINTAQILVKNKPVELKIVEETDSPIVYADPIRLRQIVWNLVNNAIKFTEQGSVTVHLGLKDEHQALIRVVDTGIGMKQEDLPLLFEQFRQVDGSSTRRAGGTGLGLHITRHLVRMHDGDISVESTFGLGSTFSFTLPVYVEEMVEN